MTGSVTRNRVTLLWQFVEPASFQACTARRRNLLRARPSRPRPSHPPRSCRHPRPDPPASWRPSYPAPAAEHRKRPSWYPEPSAGRRFHCFAAMRLHALVDLLLEVVVHLLQVVDRDQHGFARGAIGLLAAGNADIHFLVVIGSVGQPGDDVALRQRAFLAVGNDRQIVRYHERAPRRIQRRRHFVARRVGAACRR